MRTFIKKFAISPEEQEHQLLNAIYALTCCFVFVGGIYLFGVAP